MTKKSTLLWVEAGKLLGVDPQAKVFCPECSKDYLQTIDHHSSKDSTVLEREMRCPNCGAKNYLLFHIPPNTDKK